MPMKMVFGGTLFLNSFCLSIYNPTFKLIYYKNRIDTRFWLQVVYGIPVETFCVFSVNNSAAFSLTMPRTEEALHYHHWKGQFSLYFMMEADPVTLIYKIFIHGVGCFLSNLVEGIQTSQ